MVEIWLKGLLVRSRGGNLDSGVQIEQLLADLVGGKADGNHGACPEVVDRHAAVQSLHYAVFVIDKRDGAEHAAAESLSLGVHHRELHSAARHVQWVRNALRYRPRQTTAKQFRRHGQHQTSRIPGTGRACHPRQIFHAAVF